MGIRVRPKARAERSGRRHSIDTNRHQIAGTNIVGLKVNVEIPIRPAMVNILPYRGPCVKLSRTLNDDLLDFCEQAMAKGERAFPLYLAQASPPVKTCVWTAYCTTGTLWSCTLIGRLRRFSPCMPGLFAVFINRHLGRFHTPLAAFAMHASGCARIKQPTDGLGGPVGTG